MGRRRPHLDPIELRRIQQGGALDLQPAPDIHEIETFDHGAVLSARRRQDVESRQARLPFQKHVELSPAGRCPYRFGEMQAHHVFSVGNGKIVDQRFTIPSRLVDSQGRFSGVGNGGSAGGDAGAIPSPRCVRRPTAVGGLAAAIDLPVDGRSPGLHDLEHIGCRVAGRIIDDGRNPVRAGNQRQPIDMPIGRARRDRFMAIAFVAHYDPFYADRIRGRSRHVEPVREKSPSGGRRRDRDLHGRRRLVQNQMRADGQARIAQQNAGFHHPRRVAPGLDRQRGGDQIAQPDVVGFKQPVEKSRRRVFRFGQGGFRRRGPNRHGAARGRVQKTFSETTAVGIGRREIVQNACSGQKHRGTRNIGQGGHVGAGGIVFEEIGNAHAGTVGVSQKDGQGNTRIESTHEIVAHDRYRRASGVACLANPDSGRHSRRQPGAGLAENIVGVLVGYQEHLVLPFVEGLVRHDAIDHVRQRRRRLGRQATDGHVGQAVAVHVPQRIIEAQRRHRRAGYFGGNAALNRRNVVGAGRGLAVEIVVVQMPVAGQADVLRGHVPVRRGVR